MCLPLWPYGHIQHNKAPDHKEKVITDLFHDHDNEFSVIQRPAKSLDPLEHILGSGRIEGLMHKVAAKKSQGMFLISSGIQAIKQEQKCPTQYQHNT